jgi:hypothetical protein
MGLLDRIGKVLKGASGGKAPKPDAPAPTEEQKPATKATDAPSSTATTAAPSTKGLFGGDADTPAAAPGEKKTADAPSTKGLFGGTDEDAAPAAETKTPEAPPDTKGLFGAAAATETAEQASTDRKLQSDGPSSTVPAPDAQERQIMPVHPKVLMIVHNPPVPSEGGKRLTEIFKWHDPEKNARGYIEDLKKVSGGYLNYEIVERIDSDLFPPKADGFTYTPDQYVKVMRGQEKAHQPDWLDYHKRIETFDLQNRFNNGDFDEVWFFSFPYAGEYESIMGGPGGFWCNAPAIKNTDRFKRRFVMMGFNFERGVDVMLENFGHRTESIMTELYKRRGKNQDMWKRFTQYEKQNPGDAECGWMHYAPNSVKDYDWGNTTPVTSYCDDWYTYPELPRQGKTMTTKDWGGGDMRAHHLWWFEHIPKTTGETDGISNNWWEYIALARQIEH